MYHRPNIEVSGIEAGRRYVMPLVRADASGRGIIPHRPILEPADDPSLVWMTTGCGGVLRDTLKREGTLGDLGRGASRALSCCVGKREWLFCARG